MSEFIYGKVKEDIRSSFGNPNGAAMSRGVDAGDADQITRANARAARAVIRGKRSKQLHDLTVDVEGDEALAVDVEAHHGSRIVLDRALERGCWRRLESEEHAPERPDEQSFERRRGEHRGTGAPRLTERQREQSSRSEADEQREEHAGREKREEVRGMRGCGMRVCTVCVACMELSGVSVAGVNISGVNISAVTVATMSVAGVPVSIVSDVGEAADRHRGEASTAQREAKPIDVHTYKYYASSDGLVTGSLARRDGRTKGTPAGAGVPFKCFTDQSFRLLTPGRGSPGTSAAASTRRTR
jgi:hypothetical protein